MVVFSYDAVFTNTEDYNDLKFKGIFNESLLDKIDLARDFENSGIDIEGSTTNDIKKSFLNLLQHLKIVAPLDSTKYFMPCLLSSCNLAKDLQNIFQTYGTNCVFADNNPDVAISVEPLLIQFTSSGQTGSFPRGVYCCLVVQLLQDNPQWIVQLSTDMNKKIFNNLVTFFLEDRDHGHYITLIDRLFYLEIHVTHGYHDKIFHSFAVHHCILKTVSKALCKVGKYLNFCDFNLSYSFICHECKNSEVHMTKLREAINKYLFCYCNNPTKMTLSHKIWFQNVMKTTGSDHYQD